MDNKLSRYAVYHAPAPQSAWWQAGCAWLGRDAESGAVHEQPVIAGVTRHLQAQVTHAPRRYGLHATLKAPFHLAAGCTEADLLAVAERVAARQRPIALTDLSVRSLRGFLALQLPAGSQVAGDVGALAMACVREFDPLRAAPSAAELARRMSARLELRQQALLARWGYPYTEEHYWFHMTLTDRLDGQAPAVALALDAAARSAFDTLAASQTMQIDALTLFRQDHPDAPFMVWRRFAFPGLAST